MKKVLLTTTAIVGLTAPVFAADPAPVSSQPFFHHDHPMKWSGSMSIKLTNQSTKDAEDATEKAIKRDFVFGNLAGMGAGAAGGVNEETAVGNVSPSNTAAADEAMTTSFVQASDYLSFMRNNINAHASYNLSTVLTTAGGVSAVEDVIDDFLGGSHSEAMDVIVEVYENTATPNGSASADLTADLKAFADAQDAGTEALETTASINTTASLGVAMTAGDGWTASTSGNFDLGNGTVSGSTLKVDNGVLSVSVGKTAHAAASAVSTMFGMDVGLDTNSADTQLQATMSVGGAQIQVDNEMDGDNLESKSQTVGIKGSYGSMSYGLGWQADGDLGFSLGTNFNGIDVTLSRVNAGSNYSMGLKASVDLGGGMKLNASNAQNSDGMQDKVFTYSALSMNAAGTTASYTTGTGGAADKTITDAFALRAVHKSISTVGISYAAGGTALSIDYHEKAGTSSAGDNLVASGSMMVMPNVTLTGSYNKDSALTTFGASGPLGSAGTLSATMTSTGTSTLTASFKF